MTPPAPCLVLLNPEAGSLRSDPELLAELVEHPALAGAEIRLLPDAARMVEAVHGAVAEGRERLVVGGGDGTVHAVLAALLDTGEGATGGGDDASTRAGDLPVVGILPLGTANDLARSLGVDEVEDALDALQAAKEPGRMDVLRFSADGGPAEACVNVCLGGFGGEVQEATTDEMKDTWGPLAYLRGGIEVLGDDAEAGHPVRLEVDGEDEEVRELQNVIVANGRYAGGGIPVAPEARVDDGLLDLILVPALPLTGLVGLGTRMVAGRHLDHDEVVWRRARRVRVRTDPPMLYSLDGEVRRCGDAVLQVVPGALRIVVGTEAEATAGA